MARLPIVQPESLPEEQRGLLSSGINLHKVLVHSPRALAYFRALTRYTRDESALAPRLRELALIQVGYTSGCDYEYAHHIKAGLVAGLTPDDIRAVAADTAGRPTHLDPVDRATLRAARELTSGVAVSKDVFDVLQAALGNEVLIDLIIAIVSYTSTVRLLETFEVDLEDEYRPYLEQYPLAP
jgi:alkylhydroperoxidase family enzyme